MPDAENFIPTEAKIEVEPAYFQQDVKNLAKDDDIRAMVIDTVDQYEARYVGQRAEWDKETSGIWNLQDAMWRSGLNDSAIQSQKHIGANEPEVWERAKTGSTLFYRQVRQKASNGYAVQSSRDMPFRYDAISASEFEDSGHAEDRARKLNLLAKWSMKQDKFNVKCIDFWNQIYKRGNIPVMVEWIQEMGKKKVARPVFGDDGITVGEYEIEEIDTAVVNRPTITILPVEGLYADTAIGCIQDQECVIVSSVVGMTEIVDGIRKGLYHPDTLAELGRAQLWDGSSGGFDNESKKKDNRGMTRAPTNQGTGQYLKREIFVNLPVDEEKETWDELKNVPKRYRVTMFGNQPKQSVVARIERNQEPDDTIPIALIHANPDDHDLLYHISDFEVIRSNIATETTLIRQVIDNSTLVNKPPLIEVEGAVRGNDRSFGPDARYVVDDLNSISTFNIRDVSQPSIAILEYIKDDSNTANSIDKNMVGESFGARTSALEANTISGNSRRPNIVNIEYILEQFIGFVAERYKVLWEAYGRHDQIVQITDEAGERVFVRPKEVGGEYDIVIDIVDDIKNAEVEAQRLINGAQVYAQNPQLAQTMDWGLFSETLAEKLFGTNKFISQPVDGDAEAMAKTNVLLMLNQGVTPSITPNMNIKKHLEVYREERRRLMGAEEQYPNVVLLDQIIEQLEAMEKGGGQQQIAPPLEASQVQGQLTAGALGGFQ